MKPQQQRETLTVTAAHMIAAILGTFATVFLLGIVALARVGVL
ncbi:hypothetical protein [Nocardia salmonicida]